MEFIANSRFIFAKHPGTGNKSCKVSIKEKLRLSNVLVDHDTVSRFLEVLYSAGEAPMDVELSDRRTYHRWGTAWTIKRRCVLYRHTVWVMLHEIAHLLDIKKNFTGLQVTNNRPHGRDFGNHLTCLYNIWMENMDTGVQNMPQKQDVPNLKHDYFREADLAVPKQFRVPPRRARVVGGISLQVGDGVWFRARGTKIFAKVIRVNKKTCRVKPIDGSPEWRVSPKLLNKTGGTDIPISKKEYNGLKDAMAFDQPKSKPRKKRSAEDEEILKLWRERYRRN